MDGNKYFKLSMLFVIFVFCSTVLAISTADARGAGRHVGGNHAGLGSHGGSHRDFGGNHRHSGSNHKHFSGGHRSHYSGLGRQRHSYRRHYNNYRRIYRRNYNNYRRSLVNSYRPQYASRSNINTAPSGYSNTGSHDPRYSNPSDIRHVEKDMEGKVTNNAGWRLLAQNKASEAFVFFASQVGRNQNDGALKVGFALSSAIQGDLDRGVWAMRQAFRIDPNTLHTINIEPSLRAGINSLIAKYNNRLNYSDGNSRPDSNFMVAALSYLLNDKNAARMAIQQAIGKAGDNSQSAQNLYNLVINPYSP